VRIRTLLYDGVQRVHLTRHPRQRTDHTRSSMSCSTWIRSAHQAEAAVFSVSTVDARPL
jgi:hypothetical protein